MTLMLTGTGVARGIAIGPARVLRTLSEPAVGVRTVAKTRVNAELQRFRRACARISRELATARKRAARTLPAEIACVLDSHLLILDDQAFVQPVKDLIRTRAYSSEWALVTHCNQLVQAFERIDDSYLSARRDDVEILIARLLNVLAPAHSAQPGGSDAHGYVLVAARLAPADLLLHQDDPLLAIVTEQGGTLAHTAIVARSLGLPAVSGAAAAATLLQPGETLIVDGDTGMVVADPDGRALREARAAQRAQRTADQALSGLRDAPAVTRDGQSVRLLTNVEVDGDLRLTRRLRADGVGLYRSEGLFLNRATPPDEAEQYQHYRKLLRDLPGAPVTVRTLDICAGPNTPALLGREPPAEQPALGLRAIRLCLRHPELFRPQLRALLRAAAAGPLQILLPMISSTAELGEALALIERSKAELAAEGLPFNARTPIGAMIEVPAAALVAESLARRADFLAIGTNDLVQYTLAIDRADEAVQGLVDPLNPAVLKLIRATLRAAERAGVPVYLCGEMAGDARYTLLLLGLGLREFSMQPRNLLAIKRVVRECDLRRVERGVRALLASDSPERSATLLARLNAQ